MSVVSTFKAVGLAAKDTSGVVDRFIFDRREPLDHDVLIEVAFCGICHSDVHQIRAEWPQNVFYPMIPGHEIVGLVKKAGSKVSKFKVGDRVGVGCFVDSCRECEECKRGDEHYCRGNGGQDCTQFSYNCCLKDETNIRIRNSPQGEILFGGYSSHITVDESYVVRITDGIPLESAAPLLCAGITTYSPLIYYGKLGKQIFGLEKLHVGVVGFGGLGHMAVMLAKAMGHHVTVVSRSDRKRGPALEIGCDNFLLSTNVEEMQRNANTLHLIIDTVSADHDVNSLIANLLKSEGMLCIVGLPPNPVEVFAGVLISKRKLFGGSTIGNIRETQEMLDFCATHKCIPHVDLIAAEDVNEAIESLSKNANTNARYVIKVAETLTPQLADDSWHVKPDPRIVPGPINKLANVIPPEAVVFKNTPTTRKCNCSASASCKGACGDKCTCVSSCNCGDSCNCSGKTGGSCSCSGKSKSDCNCGPDCQCSGKTGGSCSCSQKKSSGSCCKKGCDCGFLCKYSHCIVGTVGIAAVVGVVALALSRK